MGLFKQLMNLFGGSAGSSGGDVGHYYYVRCNKCGEVIKVRVNPMNDLSHEEGSDGLFARKMIMGTRCFNQITAEFHYDSKRNLISSEVSGGELVKKVDYENDQIEQTAKARS